jgi:hypothetical protein
LVDTSWFATVFTSSWRSRHATYTPLSPSSPFRPHIFGRSVPHHYIAISLPGGNSISHFRTAPAVVFSAPASPGKQVPQGVTR